MNRKLRSTRQLRGPMLAATAIALTVGLSLGPAPALASHDEPILPGDKLVAVAKDTRSVGRCDFVVDGVDATNSQFIGRISASVRPQSFLKGLDNKFVAIGCTLFGPPDQNGNDVFLTSVSAQENGNRIPRHTEQVSVPVHDGYKLCAGVVTVTKSGQIFDATRCVSNIGGL